MEYWINGTIPWVSPKDMKTVCITNAEDQITQKALTASATNLIPADSVLMVTRSGILARTLPVAKNIVPVAINQDLKALTPWKGVNPDFVLAMLRWLESPIRQRCAKSGTTVSNINFPEFLKYSVPLPPLNEQRRIVTKIEALMARSARAREALDAIPALLDRYRQSILAAAFRGDLTADWRAQHPDVEPASELLERIRGRRRSLHGQGRRGGRRYDDPSHPTVRSAPNIGVFGDVEALGWVNAPLELLCDPERGVPYGIILTGADTPDGIPTVRGGDIKRFAIEVSALKRVAPVIAESYKRTKLRGNEVLEHFHIEC